MATNKRTGQNHRRRKADDVATKAAAVGRSVQELGTAAVGAAKETVAQVGASASSAPPNTATRLSTARNTSVMRRPTSAPTAAIRSPISSGVWRIGFGPSPSNPC